MNLICFGNYKKRFEKIIEVVESVAPKSVLELCFGDTVIAGYCKEKNIFWEGIDINENFVNQAKRKGFNVLCDDILQVSSFKKNDLCIISGSFYHFNSGQRIILMKKILSSTTKLLISEPIINLSEQKGFIGFIARRSANAGKGQENFRFNEKSLKAALEELGNYFNFNYKIEGFIKRDLIVLIEKNGIN